MPTGDVATALEVSELQAGYGKTTVLKSVSLRVERGAVAVVIGANGAGKSTLLGAISGLVGVRAGKVVIHGQSISHEPCCQRIAYGVAHVPEGRRIFGRLTVAENLRMGGFTVLDPKAREEREQQVFELFPILKERRWQAGGLLSGGEQQMLAIGRALMTNPSILLMDEPSMGIAPLLVDAIFRTIEQLRQRGVTILLVEQNAGRALAIASYAYVLEQGAVVLEGSGKQLLNDARVQEAYLGE